MTCGMRQGRMQVPQDVMMQSGRYFDTSDEGGGTLPEPYLCKALIVEGTSAPHLVCGLLRRFPFKFDDAAEWAQIADPAMVLAFLFSYCADRASANFVVAAATFRFVVRCAPLTVLPHLEPCGTHGAAIVKGRSRGQVALMAALHQFVKLMRFGSTLA